MLQHYTFQNKYLIVLQKLKLYIVQLCGNKLFRHWPAAQPWEGDFAPLDHSYASKNGDAETTTQKNALRPMWDRYLLIGGYFYLLMDWSCVSDWRAIYHRKSIILEALISFVYFFFFKWSTWSVCCSNVKLLLKYLIHRIWTPSVSKKIMVSSVKSNRILITFAFILLLLLVLLYS